MMLTCDEASKICDKNQYGEARLFDKIRLIFHLIFCKNCRMYSKQNTILTSCYKKHQVKLNSEECCLKEEEKIEIEEKVKIKIPS